MLFLRKCTWTLCVLSDLIYVVFWFPSTVICAAFLPERMSGGKTLFITLLPLPPTQQHYGTVRASIKDTAPGEVSLEMQTGKWSIWEIVSCIWVSDNCRLPDTHTHWHTLWQRWHTEGQMGKSEGPFRVRYKTAVGVDCFGTADSFSQ